MPQPPALVATDIIKGFEGQNAVDGYSLTLNRGDVLGLLGPNGAGKSTTLSILSGLLAPDRGRVEIMGMNLTDDPVGARKHLGFLPDTPPLYNELRVIEFLDYASRLRRISKASISPAIQRCLERCGLGDVRGRLISQLSTGYRQRLGIAQAIIHDPEVVILDEPTTGLDPTQLNAIRELIQELGQDHAVILSSHILNEVEASCNRVQIINEGQVIHEQSMTDLKKIGQSINICLSRSPDHDVLKTMPGVRSLIDKGEYCFDLLLDEHGAETEAIAALIIEQGWGLRSMTPLQTSLEHVFMRSIFKEEQPR
jgi:ABC-2 type transport system ATP-binding protein